MKASELKKALSAIVAEMAEVAQGCEKSEIVTQFRRFKSVFHYAGVCEMDFERNLREDYERKTTFYL